MTASRPYRVACLQLQLLGVVGSAAEAADYHGRALDYLERTIAAVRRSKRQAELRLVVVPEFWLCGGPAGDGSNYLDVGGVAIPGQLSADLGRIAAEQGVFIAANLVENASGAAAPGSGPFYDSAVLLDDTGRLVLHYREVASAAHVRARMVGPSLYAQGAELDQEIVARILPTAATELGRVGLLVGSDLRYGSLAAMAARSGADVIVHVANESEMCRDVWSLAKEQRTRETGCYFVSCNNAGNADPVPSVGQTSWGGSRVLDPHGRALAMTLSTQQAVVDATIDLSIATAVRAGQDSRLGVLEVVRGPSGPEKVDENAGPLGVRATASFGAIDPTRESLEDTVELTLTVGVQRDQVIGGGLGTLTVTERTSLAGTGIRTYRLDSAQGQAGVAHEAQEDIDFLSGEFLTVVGVGTSGGELLWVGSARVHRGRGADAVRQLVVDGAALLVAVTDGPVSDQQWGELLEWGRVSAWETEVHTILLGNRTVHATPLAHGVNRRTRTLAQLSTLGDVMDITELSGRPWHCLPFTIIETDEDLELLAERRVVRRELVRLGDAVSGGVSP